MYNAISSYQHASKLYTTICYIYIVENVELNFRILSCMLAITNHGVRNKLCYILEETKESTDGMENSRIGPKICYFP